MWLTFAHWAGQIFRFMTFAAGAFVVAATASLAGIATLSAIGYWVPRLAIDHGTLAIVSTVSFLADRQLGLVRPQAGRHECPGAS